MAILLHEDYGFGFWGCGGLPFEGFGKNLGGSEDGCE